MATGSFGAFLKQLRIKKGVTLREFCLTNGFDAGNYSRLERGRFAPPQREDLVERYASALGLNRGSSEWLELFDLAAASRGQLPSDLLSDKQLLAKLPALFRTLRGHAIPAEKLDDLIEDVRRV